MNKIRPVFSFLFSLITILGFSQEWTLQNPFGRIGKVQSIDFTEDGIGYAVGNNGLVVTTENFGEVWTLREPPELYNNRDVHIVKGTGGQQAYIGGQITFKTNDYGVTWERLFAPGSNVVDVHSLDADNIYFASVQGKLFKTHNGGDYFEEFAVPYGRYEGVYFLDEMNGWATGSIENEGKILHTTDRGETWDISTQSFDFVGKIEFISEQIGFVVASDGLYKTVNGGTSWQKLPGLENADNMFIYDENNIWVAWGLGYQKSIDGGQTWSEHSQAARTVECIFLSHPNTAWVGGRAVTINHTTDGGQSWSDQIPGNKSYLSTIQFYDDQIGYAGSYAGEVLKTSNGGASWTESSIPDVEIINQIELIDQNKLLVGATEGLFYSEDGAQTWTKIEYGSSYDGVESISYIDDNNILIGEGSKLFKINITGSSSNAVLEGSIRSMQFVSDQKGWLTTRQGKIYNSTDGGETWSLQYTQADGDDLTSTFFINELKGFVLTSKYNDYILKTEDGGATWVQKHIGTSSFWQDVHFINEDTGWVVGGTSGTGNIYITNDGGETWESDYFLSSAFAALSAPLTDEKLAWASGADGVIMRFSNCNTDPQLFDLSLPQTICQNDTIIAEVGFEGIDAFAWNIPEGWVFFGNDNSSQVNIVVGDNAGMISVVGSNSCEDSTDPISQQVTVIDNPNAQIVQEDFVLRSTTSGVSYQWYRNGEIVNGATGQEHTPSASGNYYVKVGYNTGCISAPSNVINIIISSTTFLNGREIRLYPNPASTQFFLKGLSDNEHIELWSVSGQLIRSYKSLLYYNIDNIPTGLYLVKIKSNHESGFLKIMIAD